MPRKGQPKSKPKPSKRRGPAAATPPVTGLSVLDLPIDRVVPYARNPRKNGAAVAKVAASIREFGFRQPIVTDESLTVIAGHTRLEAARSLGLAVVPVHVATGLTPAQTKAYRLADNRSAQEAEWDFDLLAGELGELKGLDFDLGLTGFDADEVERLLAPPSGLLDGVGPDEVPEPPVEPITKPGDLIVLGRHRLVCGDSTRADVVELALGGGSPALMVTDPPYGVEYDPNWRNEADRANGKPYGARAVGLVTNDDRIDWREAFALFRGDVVYCWHACWHASSTQVSLEECDFELRAQIIWAKPQMRISRGHYHWKHEPCWYAVRKGSTADWIGDRKQTTVWEMDHRKSDTGHGTQKPVEAMRRPLQNHGGDVYDPFLGSGTTLIAAEMMGRTCYGVEISPAYCDVIVARWEKATGQKAVRS